MLNVTWLDEVDWQHWMTSVSLSASHPSIVRDVPAEETIARLAARTQSKLADVRRQHQDVLKKLLIEIRQLRYSIRRAGTMRLELATLPSGLTGRSDQFLDIIAAFPFLDFVFTLDGFGSG